MSQADLTTTGDLVAPSPTSKVVLGIGAPTKAVNSDGSRVDLMTVDVDEETYGEPVGRVRVSEVLRFGPARSTFDPFVAVGIRYDPASPPRGVAPEDLVIGYWNGAGWELVPSTVDPATNTVVAQLTHFSSYTLLSPPSPWYAG